MDAFFPDHSIEGEFSFEGVDGFKVSADAFGLL
jgi:hypothetical protein